MQVSLKERIDIMKCIENEITVLTYTLNGLKADIYDESESVDFWFNFNRDLLSGYYQCFQKLHSGILDKHKEQDKQSFEGSNSGAGLGQH